MLLLEGNLHLPVHPWVALEQEAFLGLSGTRPEKTTCSVIDFRGNPGIRALYQAIGFPTHKCFTGLSRDFPGIVPGLSRHFLEISL